MEENQQPDAQEEEIEEPGLVEDPSYLRVSAYAIASFVLSLVAVSRVPGGLTRLFVVQAPQSRLLVIADAVVAYFAVPVVSAAVAIFLAGRGEDEIVLSAGRIGGLGFCRTARAIAYAALVLCTVVFLGALVGAQGLSPGR